MAQDYFSNHEYLSQSSLKALLGRKYDNPSQVGNITDMLCTSPEERDQFKITKSKVTPALKVIMDRIIVTHDEICDEAILLHKGDYGKGTYGIDRIKKDLLKFEDYWYDLTSGLKIVTSTEWEEASRMAGIVKDHKRTQFVKGARTQVAIYNEDFYGFKVKGLVDYLLDNNQIVDLKTIHSIKAIYKNWAMFRYDIQGAWYKDISHSKYCPIFIFVAPDADYPVVVQMQESSLAMARHGGMVITETWLINGKEYKNQFYKYGYLDLLREYSYLKGIDFTIPPNDYETIIHGIKKI